MRYSTNLTDKQWQVIEKFLDDEERKRKRSLRFFFNAIFYLVKTGCQRRMLPSYFAPWNTVYYYYCKWKNNGLIEEKHENLRDMICEQSGMEKDEGKETHIITDTLGLVLVVVIHAANIHDSKGAMEVIGNLKGRFPK